MTDSSGNRRQPKPRLIAAMVLAVAGFALLGVLAGRVITQRRAQERFAALSGEQIFEETVQTPAEEEAPPETTVPLPADVVLPEKTPDWDSLHEENGDIYAWITVPGTNVDYPVLQNEEELDYYLDHNLDHSKGYPGCIYTRYHNAKDFEDPNTILYGHNMKDGSMFKTLHYFEDGAFFEEHPYIYVWTKDRLMVYEIFAAYRFTDDDLLSAFDFSDREVFSNYLESLMKVRNLYVHLRKDTFVPLDADCRIITLSTCIAGADEVRYLVQGVRIGVLEDL